MGGGLEKPNTMSKMKDTLEDRDYNGKTIPVPTPRRRRDPSENGRTLADLERIQRGPLDNGPY